MGEFALDRLKLRAVILHTIDMCGPDALGAVKLNKVLYFLDMTAFVLIGKPVTGATYRKRPHGPMCAELNSMLRRMEDAGEIGVTETRLITYRKINYHLAGARPPAGVLSNAENEILEEVVEFVCRQNTARTISEFSHQLPWQMAEDGGVIPYQSAFLLFPADEPDMEDMSSFDEDLAEIYAAKARGEDVGSSSLSDLRERVRASIRH